MRSLGLIILVICSATLSAGEFNPDKSIGDAAPAWEKLPGTDGKLHSSDDLKDAKVLVVIFTCNSCPYAVDAEERLIALSRFCQDNDAVLVAMNVNKVAADLLPAMKDKAKTKGYDFAYLFDETQSIAKQFGARYTPECFVLDAQRSIAYMGSIDDSPDGKSVTKTYARDAIKSVLAGETPAITESVPVGCRIRYDRVRRTRRQLNKS